MRWVQSLPKYEDPEDRTADQMVRAGARQRPIDGCRDHGEVLSVSPYTGAFLSKLELTDKLSVAPVVASGSVFFLSDDADLIVYR